MTKPHFNPYDVLEIKKDATDKDIKNAYKVQCLKWHPDKNPNNKEQAETRFIAAKEAFEFLYDKQRKEEYDKNAEKVRVRDEKQRERMQKADGNRRQFIEELNRREKEFATRSNEPAMKTPSQLEAERKRQEKRMKADFEELRQQLEKEVAEEMEKQLHRLRKAVGGDKMDKTAAPSEEKHSPKLRVQWKPDATGDYDEAALRLMFEPYGSIAEISPIMTRKKGGKMCIIEFEPSSSLWGAELENGAGVTVTADWQIPPPEAESSTNGATKEEIPIFQVVFNMLCYLQYIDLVLYYASMSFEEVERHFACHLPPPQKKTRPSWTDEHETIPHD